MYVNNVNLLTTVTFSGSELIIMLLLQILHVMVVMAINVDTVHMSEGGVANSNVSTDVDLVTCMLTVDNNINANKTDTMCTGSCVTDIVDALCTSTHACPIISVDKLSSAKLHTKSPSSCEMLGIDRDKNLQKELDQSSLNFNSIKSK